MRIIICSDGTWNRLLQTHKGRACPTNIFTSEHAHAAPPNDGWSQAVFYDEVIGVRRLAISRVLRGATGPGLEMNSEDACRQMDDEPEGEGISFFGLGRGASTVCSRTGLSHSFSTATTIRAID